MIVLDLNLPIIGGKDVLERIKIHPVWKRIPTLIFSTADVPEEINDCYERYANAYMVKPDSMKGYRDAAQRIRDFWFDSARLAS